MFDFLGFGKINFTNFTILINRDELIGRFNCFLVNHIKKKENET